MDILEDEVWRPGYGPVHPAVRVMRVGHFHAALPDSHDRRGRPAVTTRLWHPYLRVTRVIRTILGTRWDAASWTVVKPELRKALLERGRIRRAGWFN